MQKQIDLTTLSDIELKALAYEQMKLMEISRANIIAIEKELGNRLAPSTIPET